MSNFFYCGSCSKRYTNRRTVHLRQSEHVARNIPLPPAASSTRIKQALRTCPASPDYLDCGNGDSLSVNYSSPESISSSNTSSLSFESHIYPDSSLSDKFDSYCRSGLGSMVLFPQHQCEVNLLHILKGVPLKLYDEIIDCVHTAALSGVDFKKIAPRKRQVVLNYTQKRFDMLDIPAKPKSISAWLPADC